MRHLALALYMLLLLYLPVVPLSSAQRLPPPKSYHSEDEDDDQPLVPEDDNEEFVQINVTNEKGLFVGAPCEFTCSSRLQHVYCNPVTNKCDCEKKYPVKLNNAYYGCSKPKKLGEQCYYHETCVYTDQHASCIQIHHNAICLCQNGYHSVSIQKPSQKVFCAEDVQVITKDFSTFAGVLSGIAILSGLLCFVLHLFNQNLYGSGHHRHRFGNANLAPPIMYASDPGSLPLPILARAGATSQASTRRTGSSTTRRASSVATLHGYGAATVPQSRTGSRRPSIASIHSTSSMRSYSARRYEREREQKEEREMQRRLSKMNSMSIGRMPPTPSPHSTDDLLPTLEEDKQTEATSLCGHINTSYAL
ncbi:uncharacterized protein LOC109533742 isoform X2 [Dendroctonus ponderosae]|uniref:uncharacterized protein LOC109533742 isoform X2 n=1 Tax=Dendroctonus ponderosae TaxID=77166 RepID=UPI0020356316|nr:uncharacterized protein LOC109533742 isoform X2 [Dendroctonus ponderosae]